MAIGRLLRRLRAVFRRRKTAKPKVRLTERAGGETVVIVHQTPVDNHNKIDKGKQIATIPTAELLANVDSQSLSFFFGRLPLELRRLIYREVWKTYLKPRRMSPSAPGTDLRLHIYRDRSAASSLTHTRCRVHPGEPIEEDTFATAPWPFATPQQGPSTMPPRWFWEAWIMRLNWGRHWKCQYAVQKRWDPRAGKGRPAKKAPFLPLFLTCKRMYVETMQSFLENVTLVFTSSLDAHQFFVNQHLDLAHLRCLELSFTNNNDHLYLTKIVHDDPIPPVTADSNDDDGDVTSPFAAANQASTSAAAAANGNHNSNNNGNGNLGTGPLPASSSCPDIICHVDLFGMELWHALLRGVRRAAPKLRDLDVTASGRIDRRKVLECFGGSDDVVEGSGGPPLQQFPFQHLLPPHLQPQHPVAAQSSSQAQAQGQDQPDLQGSVDGDGVWQLPGKLAVSFGTAGPNYVQRDQKMVQVPVEEVEVLEE
ncbi:uncharacterized protein THITE_2129247 [Thermothielavioides terrestris NRRL 8126]|uniref:Uncharacterized protein n=2 Tax=Thermothielavioides terrestris TaxID=2587410 RepID=G2R0R2_THETT|nr:uncharacterized protein THITE_2129247 [Thermothielavioides terrestris NRRL 8126]AEO67323.1 hypothetical protein THITE_2129247 [Thermothielavioides terrestris NRRL 8126]